jgi:chemotaxis protein histidine kinase CheA
MEFESENVFHLGGLIGRREYALLGSAAKNAEKQAAKNAEKQAVKDAEKQAAKNAEKQAAKNAEKQAAKDAEKQAAKDAEKQAAKDAEKKAAKDAEEKAAKDAAEKAGKDVSKKAEKYAKYAAGAGLGAVGLYTYASADDAAEASNNTPRNITKITQADGTTYNVFFDPAIKILQSDSMNITGSQTTPTIDGPQTVSSVVNDSQIVIDFGQTLDSTTPGGSIKVTTTVDAQVDDAVTGAAETVGGAAGGAVGGALGKFFKGLGIDPKILKYVGIALVVIVVLVIIAVVVKSMSKKPPGLPVPSTN